MQFRCTEHARDRWVERCAEYGDADGRDLLAAVAGAVRVDDAAGLPFARTPNTHYYHDAAKGVYFVVEPLAADLGRVVSVIVPGAKTNYLTPKKKARAAKAAVNAAAADHGLFRRLQAMQAAEEENAALLAELIREPGGPFPTVNDEWAWHKAESARLCQLLSGMSRSNPVRGRFHDRKMEIDRRAKLLKDAAHVERMKRHAAEHGEQTALYDEFGKLQWHVAYAQVTQRLDAQAALIERLANRVAELEQAMEATPDAS